MQRLFGIVLLCGCLALPARARDTPSPETLRAAQDLAAVMTGDTIQQMTSGMIGQMWPGIEAQLGTKVDAATLAEMRTEVERTISSFTGDLMNDASAIYARYFSAQELQDISALHQGVLQIADWDQGIAYHAESHGRRYRLAGSANAGVPARFGCAS